MYRLMNWDNLAETESPRLRDFDPERRMPHEGGDPNYGGAATGSGGVGGSESDLQAQIKALQDQLAALGPSAGLGDFRNALDQYNPEFFNAFQSLQGLSGNVSGLAGRVGGLAGQIDPSAFSRENILSMQDARERGTLGLVSERFGRMGTGNTAAELNALTRARSGFGQERLQALMSGAQAQAGLVGAKAGILGQSAGLYGHAGGLMSSSLDPLSQGLQNLTIEEQLRLMELQAQNAGKSGGGGGGGVCMLFCLVLTDLLHSKGDLTDDQYIRHAMLSRMKSDARLYAGYLAWAYPLRDMALKRPWLYRMVMVAVRAYVLDMTGERPSFAGRMTGLFMRGFSAWLSHFLSYAPAHAR